MKKQEKPWLAFDIHSMSLPSFINDTILKSGSPKHFLSFGLDPAIESLLEAGWTGLSVYPPGTKSERPKLTHKRIHAMVHQDPKLVPVFGGYFIRPITVRELFDQFPGPYGIISINIESMSRMIWDTDQIQDHLPYVYIMPEDGHNEGVMHRCWDRGYTAHHVEDRLVMVKDLVLET